MGQYYTPIIGNDNVKSPIKREIDGNYVLAKLMEHSWWFNDFVNAVSEMLYKNPQRLAWVGDYADDYATGSTAPDGQLSLASETSTAQIALRFEEVYGKDVSELTGLKTTAFNLNDKYFVNHDTKEYLDCNKYYKRCLAEDEYCIHPVSLLTAVGNGYGGGDFSYPKEESQLADVGKWTWNLLSIEDEVPTGYNEVEYSFIEER